MHCNYTCLLVLNHRGLSLGGIVGNDGSDVPIKSGRHRLNVDCNPNITVMKFTRSDNRSIILISNNIQVLSPWTLLQMHPADK